MDQETSVKVAVRIRPLSTVELKHDPNACVTTIPEKSQIKAGNDIFELSFTYDYVFGADTHQAAIYEQCVPELVDSFFDGFNATILAYGQTGSGKTWTMGSSSDVNTSEDTMGIIPRVINGLFEDVKKREEDEPGSSYKIHVQFLEIYGEDIRDLLDLTKTSNVSIRETKEDGVYVTGAREEQVTSYDQLMKLLEIGTRQRVTGATKANLVSSRSHAIFSVLLEHIFPPADNVKTNSSSTSSTTPATTTAKNSTASYREVRRSKFHFVDLAGSERAKRTGAEGRRLKEGIDINKGLLALGNVISALGDDAKRGKGFVPYRDSKLTRILKDSLGGNSKTMMICCVSPASINFTESLNALRYADRARNIKNKPVITRDPTQVMIDEFKHQLKIVSSELLEIRMKQMYVVVANQVPIELLQAWSQQHQLALGKDGEIDFKALGLPAIEAEVATAAVAEGKLEDVGGEGGVAGTMADRDADDKSETNSLTATSSRAPTPSTFDLNIPEEEEEEEGKEEVGHGDAATTATKGVKTELLMMDQNDEEDLKGQELLRQLEKELASTLVASTIPPFTSSNSMTEDELEDLVSLEIPAKFHDKKEDGDNGKPSGTNDEHAADDESVPHTQPQDLPSGVDGGAAADPAEIETVDIESNAQGNVVGDDDKTTPVSSSTAVTATVTAAEIDTEIDAEVDVQAESIPNNKKQKNPNPLATPVKPLVDESAALQFEKVIASIHTGTKTIQGDVSPQFALEAFDSLSNPPTPARKAVLEHMSTVLTGGGGGGEADRDRGSLVTHSAESNVQGSILKENGLEDTMHTSNDNSNNTNEDVAATRSTSLEVEATKEHYEKHVRRLMFILDQEQLARTRIEDKLDKAMKQIVQQKGQKDKKNDSITVFPRSWFGGGGSKKKEKEKAPSSGPAFSNAIAGSSSTSLVGVPVPSSGAGDNKNNSSDGGMTSLNNARDTALKFSQMTAAQREANVNRFDYNDREAALAETLEIAQERIMELVNEMESNQDAQQIVLETKESVLRSLARQNTHLAIERDNLVKKVEQLSKQSESLAAKLRQSQQDAVVAQSKRQLTQQYDQQQQQRQQQCRDQQQQEQQLGALPQPSPFSSADTQTPPPPPPPSRVTLVGTTGRSHSFARNRLSSQGNSGSGDNLRGLGATGGGGGNGDGSTIAVRSGSANTFTLPPHVQQSLNLNATTATTVTSVIDGNDDVVAAENSQRNDHRTADSNHGNDGEGSSAETGTGPTSAASSSTPGRGKPLKPISFRMNSATGSIARARSSISNRKNSQPDLAVGISSSNSEDGDTSAAVDKAEEEEEEEDKATVSKASIAVDDGSGGLSDAGTGAVSGIDGAGTRIEGSQCNSDGKVLHNASVVSGGAMTIIDNTSTASKDIRSVAPSTTNSVAEACAVASASASTSSVLNSPAPTPRQQFKFSGGGRIIRSSNSSNRIAVAAGTSSTTLATPTTTPTTPTTTGHISDSVASVADASDG